MIGVSKYPVEPNISLSCKLLKWLLFTLRNLSPGSCLKLLNDKYYRWLPDNLPNYILNSFNARSSGYELDLHIDSVVPFKGNYPISIIVLFVLEKMGSENGATVVVPHSHKSGTYTKRKTNKKKTISAKSGDILFLDTRTWHGTTENKTENSRWLLNAVFSLWSLKQQVDFQNSIRFKEN